MRIQEAAKAVGCTQRAIKFYEEKGLLPKVARNANQYREYTQADVDRLHAIHAYRKLGISLPDIKRLLNGEDRQILLDILARKQLDADEKQKEIQALEAFIASSDSGTLNLSIDFDTIAHSFREHLPGLFGDYLVRHFAPYLNIPIKTGEQRDAYSRVLAFWENPSLRLPLLYRVSMFLSRLSPPVVSMQTDAVIQSYLNPSDEVYERLKKQTLASVRMRRNPLIRYSPGEVLKRQMMKRLKDCGYYDVFLPQMDRLSPPYKAYREALDALNARLCEDLGLYYDSGFHLLLKE